jgi:hypothetical protein
MGVREIKNELFGVHVEKNHRCSDLDQRIAELERALEAAIPHQQITCGNCKKRTTINKIKAVTEYYWNGDVGCPAGNGHYESRGTHFICPKCKMPDKNNKRFGVLWAESPRAFKEHEEHKP